MDVLQNNLAQLFSLMTGRAIYKFLFMLVKGHIGSTSLFLSLNTINSLPNHNFSNYSKFSEQRCNGKTELCFWKIKKTVEKGENAGYQYFYSFHNVFKGFLLQGHQKSTLYDRGLNYIQTYLSGCGKLLSALSGR